MPTQTMFGWALGAHPSLIDDANALLGSYGESGDGIWQSGLTAQADWPFFQSFQTNNPNSTVTWDDGSGTQTETLDVMRYYDVTVTLTDGSSFDTQMWAIQLANDEVILLMDFGSSNDPLGSNLPLRFDITGSDGFSYSLAPGYHGDPIVLPPPCFCLGTQIATPLGPRPVETLSIGDLVTTCDSGPQPILWIGRKTIDFGRAANRYMPIEIKAGAFGCNQPEQNLRVSPQHRLLMNDAMGQEILVPAKALTDLPGVRQTKQIKSVTYFSLLLENHQILLSDGIPSESYLPGPVTLSGLDATDRAAVLRIAPRALSNDHREAYRPARPVLTVGQALRVAHRLTLGETAKYTLAEHGKLCMVAALHSQTVVL